VVSAGGGLAGGYAGGAFLRAHVGASGGVSSWGVLCGAGVAALVLCRLTGLSSAAVLDHAAPAAALWLGIGRLGCALAGCCYGRPTDGPLGVRLPDITGVICERYPTQWLSAGANLLIFGILMVVDRRCGWTSRRASDNGGRLASLFVVLYAAQRLLLDSLRGDVQPVCGPLTATQLVAAAFLVLALAVLIHLRTAHRRHQ